MLRDIVLILTTIAATIAISLFIQIVCPHETEANEPVPILDASDKPDTHVCYIPEDMREGL